MSQDDIENEAKCHLMLSKCSYTPQLIGYNTDKMFLVLEYIHGYDITNARNHFNKQFIASKGVNICKDICQAVCEIHRCGFLHNDIHVGNVMLCENGSEINVMIIDFGKSYQIKDASTLNISVKDRRRVLRQCPWTHPDMINKNA